MTFTRSSITWQNTLLTVALLAPHKDPTSANEIHAVGIAVIIVIGLLLSATLTILAELLRPKPDIEDARPAGEGDFKFPTAIEGRVVPLIWGTVKMEGPNIVWWGDLRQVPIKEKVKTGLFSSKRITIGFQYFVGIQFALCRGIIDAMTTIWVGDGTLKALFVVDDADVSIVKPDFFGGDKFGTGGIEGDLRVHPGNETQLVDTYLSTFQTPQPAYRGTCYAVFEGGYIGNSTQIKPWKFELQRFPDNLSLPSDTHIIGGAIGSGGDSNPMEVIYEVLTDNDWGLGFPATDIDLVNFQAAAATLFTEGNGFSMILDRALEAVDFLQEVERQIDGVLFLDHETGKLKINLARGGYDIDTIPQITSANIISVNDFSRGTWSETANQVRVQFVDRDRDYFGTFAQSQNLANQRIQGGRLVAVTEKYPGVKDKTLANNIASRTIKMISRPLAKANITVDRSLWQIKPADVVAWTDATLGFTKQPMRVARIDFGTLTDGKIQLQLIEDVFVFALPFSGEPDDTLWLPPVQDVTAIPAVQSVIIEAPKAFVNRDEDNPGVGDRIWCGGRAQEAQAITFTIYQRNHPTTPAGAFTNEGDVPGFFKIGDLRAALTSGDQAGTATVGVDPGEDTVASMLLSMSETPEASDIGQNLTNLILIDDEFIAFEGFTDQTTHIDLTNCWRGLLDTTPKDHAIDASVYLIFINGGLSLGTIPQPNVVDVQVRSESRTDVVLEGDAITVQITMANRERLPYPPAQMKINTVLYDTSADIDTLKAGGSGLDDRGFEVEFIRKDFRTGDETSSIQTDAATLNPTFPAVNTTEYDAEIIDDPDGSPTSLFTAAFANTKNIFLSRTLILRNTAGVIPTRVAVKVGTRHTFESIVRSATEDLRHEFNLDASTLDNDTNYGNLAPNVASSTYSAPDTGSYPFEIGTAFATGIVEAEINALGFNTIIAATATTGTLTGVMSGDTIKVRHTQSGGSVSETFLQVSAPTSSVEAYAILTT